MPAVEIAQGDAPKRKAMRISNRLPIRVNEACRIVEALLADAGRLPKDQRIAPTEFTIIGLVNKFTSAFFDGNAPIAGEEPKEKICRSTSVTDATCNVDVKMWDKAAFEILDVTATGLRSLWEQGVDDTSEQRKILAQLNEQLDKEIECVCSTDVWHYGKDSASCRVNINVNVAEVRGA